MVYQLNSSLTPPHPPTPHTSPSLSHTPIPFVGAFDEDELVLISEALEQQEQYIMKSKAGSSSGVGSKLKSFVHNTYVQYAALGLAAVLVLAAIVGLTVFTIKRCRASKQSKQQSGAEEGQGLLQPYDTVV